MNDVKNPVYEGMYVLSNSGYYLSGEAFTDAIVKDIQVRTGLRKSDWLGDWWLDTQNNPEYYWDELVTMALSILQTDATCLFVSNLYESKSAKIVRHAYTSPLPVTYVSGAKRINAECGVSGDKFRLYGKDESCCVEGTWFDWCCFACNILASENTKVLHLELYEPALANNNY